MTQVFMTRLEYKPHYFLVRTPSVRHFVLSAGLMGKVCWISCSAEFLNPWAGFPELDSRHARFLHDTWVERIRKKKV
jgi:hypothetical protein